jgi:glutathione S-transferase
VKLYMFPVAPNPTKVRLYLAEKAAAGNELDVTQVPVNLREGQQRNPEHLTRNPMGKLPVLELDDGSVLIESLAIIEYLEELSPEPPLIGRDPAERARVRAVERVAELGVLYSVARIVHATNSPLGLPPNPAAAAYVRETLLPGPLAHLDAVLSDGRPFVAGDAPTVADCTLAAALQFARFGKMEILEGHEHMARWDRAFRERPSAASVLVV